MDLKEEVLGDITVLEVKGRVDSSTAPVLGERLTGLLVTPSRRLILDMRDLEYISSAGFRVLLLAAKRAEEAAVHLVLCSLSGKVRQLFDLGGFLELFAISSSRNEAVTTGR
ncbi:MAG: STAS domain-containing protein [Gammaproteobacteria bacterium]|nr:STAS domain-containing protein [Gammaproteobacteria bacterium]